MSFWDIIWFIIVSFAFIAYLMVLFNILFDIFRDHGMSGGVKAIWVICLVLFPLITAVIYLIARGPSMASRQVNDVNQLKAQQDAYIKSVAGSSSPASEIAQAKQLLDSGTITQAAATVVSAPVTVPSWWRITAHCAANAISATVATERPTNTLDSQVSNRQIRCTSARGRIDRKAQPNT